MQKRQIKMEDGRYLIFYTFTDAPAPKRPDAEENQRGNAADRQPEAKPEAEEERGV